MGNDYATIRVEKIKTRAAMKNRLEHNHRTKTVLNADPDIENPELKHQPKNAEDALGLFNDTIGHVEHIRKNAVLCLEYLLTSDRDHFKGDDGEFDMKYIAKWAEHSLKFIIKKHGRKNIVSATLHMDERTPHLHVMVVPVKWKVRQRKNTQTGKMEPVPGAKPKLKLCAQDFVGSPGKLQALWTDYAHFMPKRFGLKRAQSGGHATHTDVSKFHAIAGSPAEYEAKLARLKELEEEQVSMKRTIDALTYQSKEFARSKERALQEQADTHAREIKERENKIDNLKYHLALAKEDKNEYIKKEQKNIEALKNSEMQKTADECERKRQESAQEREQSKKDNDKYIEDEKEKLEQYKNTQLTNLEHLRKLQEQALKKRERELEQREREAEEYKRYKDRYQQMQKLVNQLHGKGGNRMLTPEDIINEAVDAYNKRVQQQRTQEKYRGRS